MKKKKSLNSNPKNWTCFTYTKFGNVDEYIEVNKYIKIGDIIFGTTV